MLCFAAVLLFGPLLPSTPGSDEPNTGWRAVRILDLPTMPWTSPTGRPAGWKFKNIHTIESTGGGAELVFIPPNWTAKSPRHYDKESGWYFFLAGENAVVYYTNPQDQTGKVYHNKAGVLFHGVEGAIHGFDERTLVTDGCVLLGWHDKRPTIEPVPFDSKETTFRGGPWPYPKVFDTRDLAWRQLPEGYFAKKLYEVNGVTLEMRYYPPGWKSSGPKQYADHERWIYLLDGSLNLKVYEWPADAHGKEMRARTGQVIEVPARSILGGGDTVEAGEIGAWLLIWSEKEGHTLNLN